MVQAFIPKQIEGMPDSYTVEISVFGDKIQKYNVVNHRIVDKVYDHKKIIKDGKEDYISVVVGPHPTPFWEFSIKENDQLLCVPVGSATIKFGSEWYKICQLRAEHDNKK